jgi:7-carboxy-7-deazaguanine synthase
MSRTLLPIDTVPVSAQHRVSLLREVPPGELLVHEIYRSIQGESTFAGLPCVFIRTAVCDLRCSWCDTPHAFNHGERMPRREVLRQALALECPLVELTGGEPLLQPDVLPLMSELADAGRTVLLETSGAHDVSGVDPRVHIIMDLKCPDSGESQRNWWPNLDALKDGDEVKFVIASRADWDWAIGVIREHRLQDRLHCLVSTSFGEVRPADLAAWLLDADLPNVRMQIQMHKVIWDPNARGV